MRYKKTPQSERRTYKVLDEQGQMIAELKPDENGVTADMIKKLHAVDDHEVYVNCKELRLPPYLEECYREWRQRYISQYIQEHGSHPKTDEIPTAHRQIVYLDEIRELPESNAAVQLELSHYYDDEPSDPVLLLRELVTQMPQRWQEVYRLAMLMEYKKGKRAIIIDHVGNYARHGMPDADRKWDLHAKKAAKKQDKQAEDLKIKQCPECYYTFEPPSFGRAVCPTCGYMFPKQERSVDRSCDNLQGRRYGFPV